MKASEMWNKYISDKTGRANTEDEAVAYGGI